MTVFGKFEIDINMDALASKFYEIFYVRPYILANISPDKIKSCELLKGEWSKVGSILNWTYILDGKSVVAKDLVEAVDEEKNLITYKKIEGELLEDYKSFKFTIQCIEKDQKNVVRWTFEYETLPDEIIPDSRSFFQLYINVSKDIDAYLTQGNQEPHADVAAGCSGMSIEFMHPCL